MEINRFMVGDKEWKFQARIRSKTFTTIYLPLDFITINQYYQGGENAGKEMPKMWKNIR